MPRLVTLCSLLCVWVSLAPGLAPPPAEEVKGVVQEVDVAVGTITVLVSGPKAAQVKTFNLSRPDLPVTDSAGKPLKLTDIQADHRIQLTFAKGDVSAIRLAPPWVYGTVLKVDSSEPAVVLKTRTGERTVAVPAEAKVILDNEAAALKDLKTGTAALVAFTPDRKAVVEVRAGKGVVADTKLHKSAAYLLSADRDKRTVELYLRSDGGDHSVVRAVGLARDATFELLEHSRPFRDLTLDELAPGQRLYAWTEGDTGRVAHLGVEMPTLGKRKVKEFDAAKGRLVLEDPDGDKVLQLSPQLKVRTVSGTGQREDIKPGVAVSCGLSPDRRTVEVVRLEGK